MGMSLINRIEVVDKFLFGENDMSILGDEALDQKVIDIINEMPEVKAVPYYQIARTILKVRAINSNYEYIKRQDVIDLLWKLIDVKTEAQEVKEAADGNNIK